MSAFVPLTQALPPKRWVKGMPDYDGSFKLTKLITMFSKHLYEADGYQDFNVFYAFIFDDLKNTIANLSASAREAFEKDARAFSPKPYKVEKVTYSEEPEDYDAEKDGEFVPQVLSTELVDSDVMDWTSYLLEAVVSAKGWVYTPMYPAVPFTDDEAAPYHMRNLRKAVSEQVGVAVSLKDQLELDI